jgi:hypothetical protein
MKTVNIHWFSGLTPILLPDSCPNPLDNMRSSVPVDSQGKTTSHSQVRRFDVKTFSFVDPETGNPSVEEVRSILFI